VNDTDTVTFGKRCRQYR